MLDTRNVVPKSRDCAEVFVFPLSEQTIAQMKHRSGWRGRHSTEGLVRQGDPLELGGEEGAPERHSLASTRNMVIESNKGCTIVVSRHHPRHNPAHHILCNSHTAHAR